MAGAAPTGWTNFPYFYIGDFYPGSEVWNWGNKPYIPGFVTHMTWHSFKWANDYFGPGDCYTISAVVSPGNYWTDLPNVYQYNKQANGPACPPASMFFYNETRLIGQPQPNTSYSGSVWFYKTYPYTEGSKPAPDASVTIQGFIAAEGTMGLADYARLADNPDVFVADVSGAQARRLAESRSAEIRRQGASGHTVLVRPLFWALEDAGLAEPPRK